MEWANTLRIGSREGRRISLPESCLFATSAFLTDWLQALEQRGSKRLGSVTEVPGTDVHLFYHKDAGESTQGWKVKLIDNCWAVTAFIFVSLAE